MVFHDGVQFKWRKKSPTDHYRIKVSVSWFWLLLHSANSGGMETTVLTSSYYFPSLHTSQSINNSIIMWLTYPLWKYLYGPATPKQLEPAQTIGACPNCWSLPSKLVFFLYLKKYLSGIFLKSWSKQMLVWILGL